MLGGSAFDLISPFKERRPVTCKTLGDVVAGLAAGNIPQFQNKAIKSDGIQTKKGKEGSGNTRQEKSEKKEDG